MPEPTIDLQRDCELWCDFDTDYFDSQRNKILDRSGNGRHPEASGGPTLGANGPDNFEAASFDGGDDLFRVSNPDNPDGDNEIAFILSFRTDDFDNGTQKFMSLDGFSVILDNSGGGRTRFGIDDANGNFVNTAGNISPNNNFQTVIAQLVNGNRLELYGDGTLDSTQQVSGPISVSNNADLTIGAQTNSTSFSEFNVAFAAQYSRSLSDAEIEYLTRLTEPRRAQL
jgi:hypothetical protein